MTGPMPPLPVPQTDWRQQIESTARLSAAMPRAALARLLAASNYAPRFTGAYSSRQAADAAAARFGTTGFEDDNVTDALFDLMCRRPAWDYPIIYWLNRLLPQTGSVVDAGGHLGTKFIAFSEMIDLSAVDWTVYDLPGVIRTARLRQSKGELPARIRFEDRLEDLPDTGIFLCSGLLQYLDMPFPELIGRLSRPPRYILLNKVALREGISLFTLEKVGRVRIPYHIRNHRGWLREIEALGYEIMDTWTIPDLGHVISTHPWHGRSTSRGYALRLIRPD